MGNNWILDPTHAWGSFYPCNSPLSSCPLVCWIRLILPTAPSHLGQQFPALQHLWEDLNGGYHWPSYGLALFMGLGPFWQSCFPGCPSRPTLSLIFFFFFKRTSQSTPDSNSSKKLPLSIFSVLTKYTLGNENFKWHYYNSYRTLYFPFKTMTF